MKNNFSRCDLSPCVTRESESDELETKKAGKMRELSDFSVQELKELLKARKLSTTGSKMELIKRAQAGDPGGNWIATWESAGTDNERPVKTGVAVSAIELSSAAGCAVDVDLIRKEAELYRREKELVERELALARKEIEMLRRAQISADDCAQGRNRHDEPATNNSVPDVLDSNEDQSADMIALDSAIEEHLMADNVPIRHVPGGSFAQRTACPTRVNVAAMAKLINSFEGDPKQYEVWEGQIRLLRDTFNLDDGKNPDRHAP